MKVLVIEDNPEIVQSVNLCFELRWPGAELLSAAEGKKGLDLAGTENPEVIILDLGLPDIDGLEVLREIRSYSSVPVIILTVRGEEMDKVKGLEMGADDYIVKPFSPQELVSRVRAVLRRTKAPTVVTAVGQTLPEEQPLIFDGLSIDPNARTVRVNDEQRTLTAKEFDLLLLLARYPQRVFTRDELLNLVWGFTDYIDPNTITVHVRRLREKIEEDPSKPRYINTVWGVGYRFEP